MEVLRYKGQQVRDNVEGVSLELELLGWCPPSDDRICLNRLRVKVDEKGAKEAFLHHDLMSLNVVLVKANREDLCPEQLFQLKILISNVEDWLILLSNHLIKDCISDHLLKNALSILLLVEEELVAFGAGDNIVDENADFIA